MTLSREADRIHLCRVVGPSKEIGMFGKPYAEYIRFQWPVLAVIAVVGLARLALSLAGMPNSVVRFVSVTVVGFAGFVYYGLRVGRTGFGTYRHLVPLIFNQGLVVNAIAIFAIALGMVGWPNIYDAPEFRGPGGENVSPTVHILAHLFIGTTVPVLIGWAIASLVMRFGGRPANAR